MDESVNIIKNLVYPLLFKLILLDYNLEQMLTNQNQFLLNHLPNRLELLGNSIMVQQFTHHLLYNLAYDHHLPEIYNALFYLNLYLYFLMMHDLYLPSFQYKINQQALNNLYCQLPQSFVPLLLQNPQETFLHDDRQHVQQHILVAKPL